MMFILTEKRRALPALLFLILLGGCSRQPEVRTLRGAIMGTTYDVTYQAGPKHDPTKLEAGMVAQLELVNSLMSNWVSTSDTSRFNRHAHPSALTISPHTARVIASAIDVAKRTDGALDPTISPLIELWGFGKGKRVARPDISMMSISPLYGQVLRAQSSLASAAALSACASC